MDEEDKRDVEWALTHELTDLSKARRERMKAMADNAVAAREVERVAAERAKKERAERLRDILARHKDRWVVSINGKIIRPGKDGLSFACPNGHELETILDRLAQVMGDTFPKFATEDFSVVDSARGHVDIGDTTCGKCGTLCRHRVIPIPY